MIRINKKELWIIPLIGLLCIISYINYFNNFSFKCIFNELTGLYCPGCGTTRMMISLTKGEIYQAFRWNPHMFIVIWILPIMISVVFGVIELKGNIAKWYNRLLIVIAVITILFGILRNLAIFRYLAPTQI